MFQYAFDFFIRNITAQKISGIFSASDLGVKVSGQTICRWLISDAPQLRKHLPHRGKKYKNRLTPKKRKPKPETTSTKRSIHERPAIVERRLGFITVMQ